MSAATVSKQRRTFNVPTVARDRLAHCGQALTREVYSQCDPKRVGAIGQAIVDMLGRAGIYVKAPIKPVKPVGTSLTEREMHVLKGIADGSSNAEIGRDLFITEDTVKTHVRRLSRKLGAKSRAHAVRLGVEYGLLVFK